MKVKGAGGTKGGIGRFFIGLVMMIGGGYLFFDSIKITTPFTFGYAIFSWGAFRFTTGMVFIPFIFGIGLIFYNAKNILGWVLTASTLVMLGFGVISNIHFIMRGMSAFDLMIILGLFIGGLGLFLSSLRNLE